MCNLNGLAEKILKGDKRSAAKAITIIENDQIDEKKQLLKLLYPFTGKAKSIGITGPPGAGKSTLVDGLIQEIRNNGLSVGVIAVDPSSPYTGGALLGDRIRMQRHATDPKVFIRSMGNRGVLGGLAKATNEAIYILDAMGLDIILIETVGVGQSELEIVNIADTTVLVLNPRAGDTIQAFKAGIMEAADIFVVNKSDLEGAEKLKNEIEMLIDTIPKRDKWQKIIVKTISTEKKGIDQLYEQTLKHLNYIYSSGFYRRRKTENINREILHYLEGLFKEKINNYLQTDRHQKLLKEVIKKEINPMLAAEIIFSYLFEEDRKKRK